MAQKMPIYLFIYSSHFANCETTGIKKWKRGPRTYQPKLLACSRHDFPIYYQQFYFAQILSHNFLHCSKQHLQKKIQVANNKFSNHERSYVHCRCCGTVLRDCSFFEREVLWLLYMSACINIHHDFILIVSHSVEKEGVQLFL